MVGVYILVNLIVLSLKITKDTTCDTSLTGQTLLRRRKGLVTCLTSSCALEVLMHHLTSPVWIISKIFEESKVQE